MTKRPLLVLGGRSDIGLAIAQRFAAEGWPVVLAGRDAAALEPSARDIALRHRVPATTMQFDVLDFASCAALFETMENVPSVVVSVVGLLGVQVETEGDPTAVEAIVGTNFTGPAIVLEAAAKRLAELAEDTAVIGVSSVAGDRGRAVNYWYGASKAGLSAALSGLRQKYARSRLLVMTVKPGFVRTAMTQGMDLPARLTSTPDEIARMVFSAYKRRRPVVYPWKWWIVMTIIKLLPERIFTRLKF